MLAVRREEEVWVQVLLQFPVVADGCERQVMILRADALEIQAFWRWTF
jgi:hypothetical protein